jgi:REP element-mobilizing transposase RayT
MNKIRPTRRSIRLQGFDYTQPGAYFVTICTHRRQPIFGWVREGAVGLNAVGAIVAEEWLRSAEIRAEVDLDEYIVMPNHLHGIVVIEKPVGREQSYVGATGRSPLRRCGLELKVWQRNYYERVIRNDRELNAVRRNIQDNPRRWGQDPHHIAGV